MLYEVITVRGLLAGLALGQDLPHEVWYHCDEDIAGSDCEGSMRRSVRAGSWRNNFV